MPQYTVKSFNFMGTEFHDVTIMKCLWTLEFLDFISYAIELKKIIIFFVIFN